MATERYIEMINFKIDEIVPCLKETSTGDIYETEVIRIRRKSVLSRYNSSTGWVVNWSKFPSDSEVYALVLKGTNDVQGLIAVSYSDELQAVHILWACTSPENNVWKYGKKKFSGVGGHLFAIAAELSARHGYDGYIYGEAMDRKLLEYYIRNFGAMPLPADGCYQYRFMLSDEATEALRKVYSYAWTEEVN